ncbi:MAG: carboxylating nicotinate-nucleotide diphosphorylase [Planctomycetaceae bacterium]|nr:carboxylating nicotinate-nucleotide diphosphorylase [Planctomycetaceae bacterium]
MDYTQYTTKSFNQNDIEAAQTLISLALREDLGNHGDLTSSIAISPDQTARVAINARQGGIVSGLPIAAMVLQAVDQSLEIEIKVKDGLPVVAGQTIAVVTGLTCQLLIAERTVLNFMTHLAGIATLTSRFVDQVAGTSATILDTRKTHPGFRLLEKYAVRCGGGDNHRIGLYDAVLIKDNHLAARKISHPDEASAELLKLARATYPGVVLEVEVDTLEQFQEMIPGQPDIVLLDNMSNVQLKQAVEMRNRLGSGILLEASGGVDLKTVKEIASTGVDRISIGAITHSAPAFDFGFDWVE